MAKNTGIVLQAADVNAKDEYGNVPLYYVTKNFDKEFVDLLLADGANVNIRCEDGNTPLHKIFEQNNYEYIMRYM